MTARHAFVLLCGVLPGILAVLPRCEAGDWPQWRGPNRDNISTDVGLLDKWPQGGPTLLWRVKGLGYGISGPSMAGGRIFAISQHETTEYVRALDQKTGRHLWTVRLGTAVRQSPLMRWLTQRPPTIDGERLYAVSLAGELVCFQAGDGREMWRRDYTRDFGGEHGVLGYSDCPLIDGARLICTPGGPEQSIVALDKATGKLLWACDVPKSGRAAYSNGVVAEIGGRRQFISFLEGALVAVDVEDGKLLWRVDGVVDTSTHPHTPLVRDRQVICINGFGEGMKRFEISKCDEGFSVKEVYSATLRLIFGRYSDDTVLVGDHLFEASTGVISGLDWKSGKVLWRQRSASRASTTYAQGHFYLHETDGTMKLVELTDKEPVVKSAFTLPDTESTLGTTTPIVTGGRLYVREDDQLFCYDVRKDAEQPADRDPATVQLESVQAAARPVKGGGYWPQWRGPNRDNVAGETGLLKKWPQYGPPLVWQVEGIGEGVPSLAIAQGSVITMGYLEGQEYALALREATGELIWRTKIGPAANEIPRMRWLSQRTPTIDEDRTYVATASGELVCLQSRDGKELWRKNYVKDFQGQRGVWGYCDFPLVDGEKLICTPGGEEAALIALNKKTGQLIWKAAIPSVRKAAHSAVVVVTSGNVRQYVQQFNEGIVSVRADDGGLLWQHERAKDFRGNVYTPIVRGEQVVFLNGWGTGYGLLKLSAKDNAVSVSEVYFHKEALEPWYGSAIAVGEHLYACKRGALMCIEINGGEVKWRARPGNARGHLAMAYADGHLYLRSTEGTMSLVEANPKEFIESSIHKFPNSSKEYAGHFPVIAGGRLYYRDQNSLFVYDLREDSPRSPDFKPAKTVLPAVPAEVRPADASSNPIFVPTPQDVVKKMLEVAKLTDKDTLVDLGSGDGRIVLAAAKRGARSAGYEIDRELVGMARMSIQEAKMEKLAAIKNEDMYTADLSKATLVAVYLPPDVLERLKPQFAKMPSGARIVSHQFEIPDVKPDQSLTMTSNETGAKHRVLLYSLPLKPAAPKKEEGRSTARP